MSVWFGGNSATLASGARAVLFCLPHAGGAASVFYGWAQALAPDIQALPIQLPGRERRIAEPPEIDPIEIAAAVAAVLNARGRPAYAFYGHSLGGWLSFDVIRELRAKGLPPPVRLYVGAARPPDIGLPEELRGLANASPDEMSRRLVRLGGIPPEVFDFPELLDLALRILRADFGWLEGYSYRPEAPLDVPIVAFAAAGDQIANEADMAGWARHTNAGLTLRQVSAGHLFAQELRDQLTGFIKADLLAGRSDS